MVGGENSLSPHTFSRTFTLYTKCTMMKMKGRVRRWRESIYLRVLEPKHFPGRCSLRARKNWEKVRDWGVKKDEKIERRCMYVPGCDMTRKILCLSLHSLYIGVCTRYINTVRRLYGLFPVFLVSVSGSLSFLSHFPELERTRVSFPFLCVCVWRGKSERASEKRLMGLGVVVSMLECGKNFGTHE